MARKTQQRQKRRRRVATASSETMRRMVRRIVESFHPERIILFGSRARGTALPESDVDLLVVMRTRESRHRQQTAIRLALRDFAVAKDIVVTTPEDFAWRSETPGTIERPAALEGKILYAKAG